MNAVYRHTRYRYHRIGYNTGITSHAIRIDLSESWETLGRFSFSPDKLDWVSLVMIPDGCLFGLRQRVGGECFDCRRKNTKIIKIVIIITNLVHEISRNKKVERNKFGEWKFTIEEDIDLIWLAEFEMIWISLHRDRCGWTFSPRTVIVFLLLFEP